MLKKFYNSKSDIPAGQEEFYVEKDGKFVLNVDGGFEDVSGLKSALEKERARANTTEKELKAWKESGIDSPEKVKAMKQKIEDLSKLDPKTEAEKIAAEKLEIMRGQLAEQYGAKEKELQTENESLTSQLTNLLIDNEAHTVLSKHGGDATLLLPHIRDKVRMTKNAQGKMVAQIVDPDGNPRVGADAKDMNISDLIAEMKQDSSYSRAFSGTNARGSDTPKTPGDGTVDNPVVLDGNDPYALGEHADAISAGTAVVEFS